MQTYKNFDIYTKAEMLYILDVISPSPSWKYVAIEKHRDGATFTATNLREMFRLIDHHSVSPRQQPLEPRQIPKFIN